MKLKKFVSIIIIILTLSGLLVLFLRSPGKEEIERGKNEFLKIISEPVKVTEIRIYSSTSKEYEIIIENREIINKILQYSNLNFGQRSMRSSLIDQFLIELNINGNYYCYGFDKNMVIDHKCKKQLSMDGYYFYGKNPYNDCGQLYLLQNPYNRYGTPHVGGFLATYRNIDLIPVFRKYIDKAIEKHDPASGDTIIIE